MMYFWVLFVGQGPLQEVLYEQETHTLARILAAPVTLSQFVLSKLIRCFLLCGLIQALLLLLSSFLFGVHWGNPGLVAATIAASAFSMTGFLGFIYSLARTKEQANVIDLYGDHTRGEEAHGGGLDTAELRLILMARHRTKGSAASAIAVNAAPARNVPAGPAMSQSAPATTLATSIAMPLTRLNIPKAVPRNSSGAGSATSAESNPCVRPM